MKPSIVTMLMCIVDTLVLRRVLPEGGQPVNASNWHWRVPEPPGPAAGCVIVYGCRPGGTVRQTLHWLSGPARPCPAAGAVRRTDTMVVPLLSAVCRSLLVTAVRRRAASARCGHRDSRPAPPVLTARRHGQHSATAATDRRRNVIPGKLACPLLGYILAYD